MREGGVQAASALRSRVAALWSAQLSPRLKQLGAARARWPLLYVLLILVKVWLTRGQSLLGIGDSPGDDRLYLELANHLARGAWLGRYNSLTLAKVPFFPMWVAANFGLGFPLLLAEQLLYAMSCLLTVIAIRPVLKSPVARMALFAVLLFSPWSFADQVMTRAAREGIYPSLAILVFASAVGLALRHRSAAASLVPWALSLGGSAAALWLTREEGIWIVPMVAAGLCVAGVHRDSWRRLGGAAALALLVWLAAIGFVLWKNWSYYDLAVLSEQTGGPFVGAFRQMVRVRTSHWRRSAPLPREAREKLYAASPEFGKLRRYLEGPDQPNWVAIGCRVYGLCDEIGAGAIHWAVREAAAQEGLLRTGSAAAAYWRRVEKEIEEACQRQTLDCLPAGSGNAVLDTWRPEHWKPFRESLWLGTVSILRLQGIQATPTPSVGPLPYLDIFRDLTRERLAGLDAQVQMLRARASLTGPSSAGLRIELRTSKGAAAEGHVERRVAQGPGSPVGLELQGYCPGGCSLLVSDSVTGKEVGQLALKPGRASFAGTELQVLEVEPQPSLPRQERLDARRLRMLDAITALYRGLLPFLVPLGVLSWVVVGVLAIRARPLRVLWLTSSVALLGFACRMLLLGIVSAVAFPSMNVLYIAPAPPLLFIACGLAFVGAGRAIALVRATVTAGPARVTTGPERSG